MARHIGYPGGLPYSCLRGVMIMEGGHNLSLQIFRNNPNCKFAIGKFQAATRCSLLQQPSLSPAAAPHLPKSPSPKSRRPGGRGRRVARWCCAPTWSPSLIYARLPQHTGAPGCPLCSTVLLTDPAAAEFWKLGVCRFLTR